MRLARSALTNFLRAPSSARPSAHARALVHVVPRAPTNRARAPLAESRSTRATTTTPSMSMSMSMSMSSAATLPSAAPRRAPAPHASRRSPALLRGTRASSTTAVAANADAADVAAASESFLSDELSWPSRSHAAGDLRDADVGDVVTLCGWVDKQRDMGGIVFADVRDHTGLCQVVSDADTPSRAVAALAAMRAEWVVRVRGRVKARTAPNDKIPTGAVEVAADEVDVLNVVGKSLPFAIGGGGEEDDDAAGGGASEEVRLKNRVLDLRRPRMVKNLRLRAKTVRALRGVLEDDHGFLEIETPMLTRSTPEGARDYLVPSRLQPGACYALPQSPQLFKQMLMVAGADRYYQVARCFRDEDLRADRQPEFTQLDIEMAFTDMDGILSLGEDLMCAAFKEGVDVTLPRPFPRMTYAEAMSKYGSDKPDVRYGLEFTTITDIASRCAFKLFSGAASENGGAVKAIRVPDGKRLSNSRLKPKGDVCAEAIKGGAGGLAFARVGEDGVSLEGGGKALCEGLADVAGEIIDACGAGAGDVVLFGAGDESVVNKSLDRVRQYVAKTLDMIPDDAHAVLWITEFPMFEKNEDEDRLEALHHPFTAPNQDDVRDGGDITKARAVAYDLVYNGVEVGGGSLRIYRRDVQEKVFDAIGLSKEEAEEKFGYLMDAFQFGAPPHGGMAFGLDRLVMMLAGASSIRDVIAFPKTATAQCLLTSAPGSVSDAQLADLHVAKKIQLRAAEEDASGGGASK